MKMPRGVRPRAVTMTASAAEEDRRDYTSVVDVLLPTVVTAPAQVCRIVVVLHDVGGTDARVRETWGGQDRPRPTHPCIPGQASSLQQAVSQQASCSWRCKVARGESCQFPSMPRPARRSRCYPPGRQEKPSGLERLQTFLFSPKRASSTSTFVRNQTEPDPDPNSDLGLE
ncbi:hypothetical protein CPLU01_10111 [Colletotrichum plurivorum]|uniref:Uncharacterized protein n=1 Tax=Colletotrichum plurivorum TaxID=2175906 RepID=A0A8H6K6M1_9PEZI|nr:hypothetical protein CPLU01_10111 [Colletotrichum plurivorum]